MLISEGKEMKRTLIELAMLIGLPVMAYFGFVQGVDGALYLTVRQLDRKRYEVNGNLMRDKTANQ